MKTWIAFWAGLGSLLALVLFWRNTQRYPHQTLAWRLVKTLVDGSLILLAALRLPSLLIGWCVMWATKPIASPGVRVTLAVLIGAAFGILSNLALEVLVFLGVFAIDSVTGAEGFGGDWIVAKQADQRRRLSKIAVA